MSASLATYNDFTPSTIVPVDAPVITDYTRASKPVGETALRLAAEARDQLTKLANATGPSKGPLRTLSNTRADQFALNPYLIEIKPGWNCRDLRDPENIAHIDSLARSIAGIGVQDALTVVLEGSRVFLTDGHCRLLATFRAIEVYGAEIKAVRVNTETKSSNPADHVLRQLLSGKPKTVLEQGSLFVRLRDNFGWSAVQIAARAGLQSVRVNQVLDLMDHANDGLKSLVASGKVSPTEVAKVLRDHGNDANKAEQAVLAGLKVAVATGKTRATGKHIAAAAGQLPSTKKALRELFATAVVVTTDDKAVIKLSADNWAKATKLLGL